MDYIRFLQYRVSLKGGASYELGFFQLIYLHLDERPYNIVYQNLKQDAVYLQACKVEKELNEQYDQLNLTTEQKKVIGRWIDSIHSKESAYNAVVFRLAM